MLVRAVGWLLLALAIAAVVHDALAWWTEGSFHLLGLGDLWSHLDMRSLSDAQSAVQRHVSTALWNWIVRPILLIPALPAFLALGLIFLWLGNRSGGDVDPGYRDARILAQAAARARVRLHARLAPAAAPAQSWAVLTPHPSASGCPS